MSLYFFSSYNNISHNSPAGICRNSITNRFVSYNNVLANVINKALYQQLTTLEEDLDLRALQLITAELLYRGIIAPIAYQDTEEEYLSSLLLIDQDQRSFFKVTTINELDLLNITHQPIVFCGIPSDLGAARPGTRYGPRLLREKSSATLFRSDSELCLLDLSSDCQNVFAQGDGFYDLGDINLQNLKLQTALDKVKIVSSAIAKVGIPFFIGGDHLFTLPIIEGIWQTKQKEFLIVQLDNHLDIQSWDEFEGDKPKILTKPTHANFISWIHYKMPNLKLLQIGIDNYQPINKKYHKHFVNYLSDIGTRISNLQLSLASQDMIAKQLPSAQDIYLSLDVDILNTIYLNATGYPASLGIDLAMLQFLINYLCTNNRLVGVDIMEFGSTQQHDKHADMAAIIVNIMLEILKNIKK